MNPFDPRAVLLAKHAQHVVLIHFPIALFIAGVFFDLLAQRTRNATTSAAARYNLVAAAVFVPPVLLTGALAWLWALGAPKIKGLLLWHLLIGCNAGILIMAVGWLHFRIHERTRLPRYRLPIELVTVALVGLSAHLGGFLSGVSG